MKELIDIKGIGNKTLGLLNKLNIYNINDLINYYPYRYETYKRSDINSINDGDRIVIDGIIESIPSLFFFNKHMNKMSFRLNIGNNITNIVLFNRGYLKSKLLIGNIITVVGKYNKKNNSVTASDIKFQALKDIPEIEPIYHIVHGLSNNQLNGYIIEALDEFNSIDEIIPDYLIEKYKFIDRITAIKTIHNPINIEKLKLARLRLKYEELFIFMMKITYLKNNRKNSFGLVRSIEYEKVTDFINQLPFILTDDQLKSITDIYNDLISNKQMNRLLQGDVGSGKTIVSFIAIYINYLSGYQSALMAPTEILAIQHYNNFDSLFSKYGIKTVLLTGKIKAKERKEILNDIKENKINVVIGTHALISNDVEYNNLGLVVTDEQHRFGVNQRNVLKNKGITPDILYMSATPIPRTYALTIYGDMSISSIHTIPNGRKNVITILKKNSEIKEVLNLMYQELKNGHQVYVIAPLIEDDDTNIDSVYNLKDKFINAFGKIYNIDILYGKMKNNEKDNVMNKFKNNEIQILISTTVIEVGIDVSNATAIVIFDSYKFGLSQLHQLRGRVGRNNFQSYCILISNRDSERLEIMTKTIDGFKISEEDFKLRGSGDLFGIKQSGDTIFNIADIKKDYAILLRAKEDSEKLLSTNSFNYQVYIQNITQNSSNLS